MIQNSLMNVRTNSSNSNSWSKHCFEKNDEVTKSCIMIVYFGTHFLEKQILKRSLEKRKYFWKSKISEKTPKLRIFLKMKISVKGPVSHILVECLEPERAFL